MVSNDWIERTRLPYDETIMVLEGDVRHFLSENQRLREQVASLKTAIHDACDQVANLKHAIHDACRELQEQAGDN